MEAYLLLPAFVARSFDGSFPRTQLLVNLTMNIVASRGRWGVSILLYTLWTCVKASCARVPLPATDVAVARVYTRTCDSSYPTIWCGVGNGDSPAADVDTIDASQLPIRRQRDTVVARQVGRVWIYSWKGTMRETVRYRRYCGKYDWNDTDSRCDSRLGLVGLRLDLRP